MSNIYIKEPTTNGKVLIHTSFGDIDIELWSKEAPLACRNFVQLCMEEYYNNVIFHRIVPGFIVQGGDPTGTGTGGESIYGKPFRDEVHQRLRFVRRGLVAMANAGPNDNGSQFFFTLGPCNDLNKKHTIFGKVTGDTVYNMVRLGEVDVDADERPLNPPCIKWTKVLANPFDDIEPRVDPSKKKKKEEEKKAKSQSRATKDYKLLSFGEEAEVDEEESMEFSFKGPKSSHDLAKDPRLSATPVPVLQDTNDKEQEKKREAASSSSDEEADSADDSQKQKRRQQVRDKLTAKRSKLDSGSKAAENTEKEGRSLSRAEEMRKESKRIARELAGKDNKDTKQDDQSSDSEADIIDTPSNPLFADYKAQQKIYREKTTVSKKKGSTREQETMAMLTSFRTKMHAVQEAAGSSDSEAAKEEDEDDTDGAWLHHKLKNADAEQRDAKDMNRDVNEDRYDITDPRNPINQRRREKDKKRSDRDRRDKGDNRREHSRSSHEHRHRRR